MLCNIFSEEILHNALSKPPLVQLEAISLLFPPRYNFYTQNNPERMEGGNSQSKDVTGWGEGQSCEPLVLRPGGGLGTRIQPEGRCLAQVTDTAGHPQPFSKEKFPAQAPLTPMLWHRFLPACSFICCSKARCLSA